MAILFLFQYIGKYGRLKRSDKIFKILIIIHFISSFFYYFLLILLRFYMQIIPEHWMKIRNCI